MKWLRFTPLRIKAIYNNFGYNLKSCTLLKYSILNIIHSLIDRLPTLFSMLAVLTQLSQNTFSSWIP